MEVLALVELLILKGCSKQRTRTFIVGQTLVRQERYGKI